MSDEFPSRRSLRNESEPDSQSQPDAQSAPTEHPLAGMFNTQADVPHATPRRRRRWVGWLVFAAVLLLLGGGIGVAWGPLTALVRHLDGPDDYTGTGTDSVTFQVAEGDTGESIARNLVTAGVTKSFDAFYQLCLKQNPAFVPGVFTLRAHMSAQAALDALLDSANRLQNTVLVTEGQTEADVFAELSSVLGFTVDELQSLGASPETFGLPIEAHSLEGFLFPATYQFDAGTTARQALQTMVDRSFEALDTAGVAANQRWNTVVLASLIQKEAGLRDDYYKVSRVFQNRMDPEQWPLGLLQSDATVAYGTGNTHRVSTTDAERADESNPYNTYVHPGMVVAPISNPGELAIDAALHPADGPWLYFVTVNLDTGETVFSTTEAEHNAAVEQWLAWMAEHPEYQ